MIERLLEKSDFNKIFEDAKAKEYKDMADRLEQ